MKRLLRFLICALLCAGLMLALSAAAGAEGLEVHFMDVGRNDGILILCGGEAAFIDAGGYNRGAQATEYMHGVGVNSLKYYIGTHAHDDHVGGAPIIIEAFRPEAVLQPHDKVRKVIIKNIRARAERKVVEEANYVTMTVGQQVSVGGATLTCIGPMSIRNVSPDSGLENDNSLVLRLTYGDIDILLSGDATSNTYEQIAAVNPSALKADVYKNAHHYQYTREQYFALMDPDYVIFSTSEDRLPDSKFMNMICAYGSTPLATAANHSGNIILRTDGRDITFDTQYRTEQVTVNYPSVEIYEGKDTKIKAYTEPRSRTRLLTFASSDPSVATVTADGRITAHQPGEAVVYVRDAGGAEAQCQVTVLPAQLTMRKPELKVYHHESVTASVKASPSGCKPVLTWTSADESIAVVDQDGRITGVFPGETTITATSPAGVSCSAKVTVRAVAVSKVSVKIPSKTMTIGESCTASASISPKNATWPEVTWTSSDESVLAVFADGTVRAVGVGKAKLTAETGNGKSKTVSMTVRPVYVDKIRLSAEGPDVLIGGVPGRNQVKLSYAIEPANATVQDVEWTTSNKKIATVDENGVVTGHAEGKVTITCRAADGSGEYERIKLKFEENELNVERIEPVQGEMIVRASRIRYKSDRLEIRMTYLNYTGEKQQVPARGILTLITPEGDRIPLTPVSDSPATLRHRSGKEYTYKIPLSANPRLRNLDLTRCDAVIVPYPGQ